MILVIFDKDKFIFPSFTRLAISFLIVMGSKKYWSNVLNLKKTLIKIRPTFFCDPGNFAYGLNFALKIFAADKMTKATGFCVLKIV